MAINLTEDQVRDMARDILNLKNIKDVTCGVGQLTTFNQLGFLGIPDKPDGWYLPHNHNDVAVIIETKASKITLGISQVEELLKNIRIANTKYPKVVGILYNGEEVRVFKGEKEVDVPAALQNINFYTNLFVKGTIDKEYIYEVTAKINDCLHFDFGIKNLYHRMIFTACALVAKRYDALMTDGMDYHMFTTSIQSSLNKALIRNRNQNQKLDLLIEVFSEIKMNLNVYSEDEKEQEHVKNLISKFIGWVTDISDCLNSDAWNGEDVMGIFFNEFNRYKGKSESGQVFTPDHITDFIYRIMEVNMNDRVLDATCGSGGFLVKAMANMIEEAGGVGTAKATEIKSNQLYGIEFDREIFALACANFLIHKDGKTNLMQMDARSELACEWIKEKNITKILMNPPYENKFGCMLIVENVLDSVPIGTKCAFILPDKKLEKASKKQMKRILSHHKLQKVIKLPEDTFFGVGVTTSVFIFETGVPQNGEEFFACYMKDDGFVTVKNKGRHDVHNKWAAIEANWVKIVKRMSGDDTCQWNSTDDCLSYQEPQEPFSIHEEDFAKTALDYLLWENNIDVNELKTKLTDKVMYGSEMVETDSNEILIKVSKGEKYE